MVDCVQKDWRELCVAVTNESDSTKLISLVQELVEALDRGEQAGVTPFTRPNQSARIDKSVENDLRGGLNG